MQWIPQTTFILGFKVTQQTASKDYLSLSIMLSFINREFTLMSVVLNLKLPWLPVLQFSLFQIQDCGQVRDGLRELWGKEATTKKWCYCHFKS